MLVTDTAVSEAFLSDVECQGWHAQLELGFRKTPVKTILYKRRRQGPLSVQRAFYPENDVCHVYLLHPPGGVVGGDKLDVRLELETGAHALVTTPGATKFYRSASETATQAQLFQVADSAVLEWLPQENIFFPGCQVKNSLNLQLEGNARAAVWEIQCFGRPVIDEAFDTGALDSHWQIYRDNKPLLIERLRVDKNRLKFSAQLNHHAVTGSFIITNVDKSLMNALREKIFSNNVESLALTLIDDLLIVRYLGGSTENAKRYFLQVWFEVRESALGRKAIIPRIWNT